MLPGLDDDQFIPTRARLCGGDLGLVHPKDRDFAAMARHAAAPDLLARIAQRTASQALVMSGGSGSALDNKIDAAFGYGLGHFDQFRPTSPSVCYRFS